MYKSPIEIIIGQMKTIYEDGIFRAIQNVGINVDREELLKALEYDRGQFEKGWKEGFHDGYIHGLEIAIIEIENTMGRTKKAEKLCAILQDYKKDKAGEELCQK